MVSMRFISNRKSPLQSLKIAGQKFKDDTIEKFKKMIIKKNNFGITKFDNDDSSDPNKSNRYSSFELSNAVLFLLVIILQYLLNFTSEFERWSKWSPNSYMLGIIFIFVMYGDLILSDWISEKSIPLMITVFPLAIGLTVSLTVVFIKYVTYDFGLIIGLVISTYLIQLIGFTFLWKISFRSLFHWGLIEGLSFTCLQAYSFVYPCLTIYYTFINHIGVLYSTASLMLQIKLFRTFCENHLYSSFAVYTNIANLFLRLICLLRFYGYIEEKTVKYC